MAHQSVEVVRRRRSRVGLDVDHFALLLRLFGQQLRNARRFFERGAVGHVDDHLELALVVERQHLDLDEAEVEERAGGEQQDHHAAHEAPPKDGPMQEAAHEAPVQPRYEVLSFAFMMLARLQNPHRCPWRHDESHQQREEHRGAGANRDRAHVRSHQSADERHRKNRGDHGQRGENGGVAHFIHGLQRRPRTAACPDWRASASGARYFPPPRWRRRPECRWRRSGRKA